jgi:hypothetical protein
LCADGFILLQAWAREQESEAATGNRHFDFASSESQDVFVPWSLPSRFKLVEPIKAAASTSNDTNSGPGLLLSVMSRTASVKQHEEDPEHAAIVKKFERRRKRNERKREKARQKYESNSSQITDISTECENIDDNHKLVKDSTLSLSSSNVVASNEEPVAQSNSDREVLQRYCHVYARGELEDICSSIPNCRLVESGYDRGNWFVKLKRIDDERLVRAFVGTDAPMPIIAKRATLSR